MKTIEFSPIHCIDFTDQNTAPFAFEAEVERSGLLFTLKAKGHVTKKTERYKGDQFTPAFENVKYEYSYTLSVNDELGVVPDGARLFTYEEITKLIESQNL